MKKEEIIKRIEIELKESIHHPYELNLVDLIADFFNKRKKSPQEEIDEELNFLMENITNVQAWAIFEYKYNKLISKRDKPNWKDDLKEKYKNNFKKTIILVIIPIFLLMLGISFFMDELFLFLKSEKEITSIINVYNLQLLMLNIIIPFFIYNPINSNLYSPSASYDSVYYEILRRYNMGGNLLFLSSLISIFNKFYGFDYYNNITWGDIRNIAIPFCIGFVFFYNSFLKIRINT